MRARGGDGNGYLESYQHGVGLADQTDGGGALLDGLESILDLEDATLRRAMGVVSERAAGGIGGRAVQGDGIVVVIVPEHGVGVGSRIGGLEMKEVLRFVGRMGMEVEVRR